jgi:hypothetical protein
MRTIPPWERLSSSNRAAASIRRSRRSCEVRGSWGPTYLVKKQAPNSSKTNLKNHQNSPHGPERREPQTPGHPYKDESEGLDTEHAEAFAELP